MRFKKNCNEGKHGPERQGSVCGRDTFSDEQTGTGVSGNHSQGHAVDSKLPAAVHF
jgi:hypothetical protein